MTDPCEDVKPRLKDRVNDWFVCHPLTGWYLAVIGGLNIALNLLDLLLNAFS